MALLLKTQTVDSKVGKGTKNKGKSRLLTWFVPKVPVNKKLDQRYFDLLYYLIILKMSFT